MRAKLGLTVVAVLGLMAAGAVRADGPSEKEQALVKENAQLKAQVEALRAEVKALREQLQGRANASTIPYGELKWLPNGLRLVPAEPGAPGVVVPQYGPVQGMPEGTVRREFNGVPYYVIPMRRAGGEK